MHSTSIFTCHNVRQVSELQKKHTVKLAPL